MFESLICLEKSIWFLTNQYIYYKFQNFNWLYLSKFWGKINYTSQVRNSIKMKSRKCMINIMFYEVVIAYSLNCCNSKIVIRPDIITVSPKNIIAKPKYCYPWDKRVAQDGSLWFNYVLLTTFGWLNDKNHLAHK